jgi:uncharacterized RDD family membrane protein YckC
MGSTRAVYEIRTPENVAFRFERAGVASRALAWAIDLTVMGAAMQLTSLAMTMLGWVLGELATALTLVVFFLIQWWYAALAEWAFSGRTLGKWALGIRTIDERGLPLTLIQASVRNLLRILDFLPGLYLVGGVCAVLEPLGRRVGDLAAGTVVVREQRGILPIRSAVALQAELGTPAQEWRDAAARLSPFERDTILTIVSQRDRLPLAVRLESFARLTAHLESRHELQRPNHMSAEKLVLLLCAELTRPGLSPSKRPSAV